MSETRHGVAESRDGLRTAFLLSAPVAAWGMTLLVYLGCPYSGDSLVMIGSFMLVVGLVGALTTFLTGGCCSTPEDRETSRDSTLLVTLGWVGSLALIALALLGIPLLVGGLVFRDFSVAG